jgi:uncharacterized protein (DUF1800 family)
MPTLTGSLISARTLGAGFVIAALAGCGGGGSSSSEPTAGGLSTLINTTTNTPLPNTATAPPSVVTTDVPATKSLASQFVGSASFGPTAKATDAVMAQGITGWIADQINKPTLSHRAYFEEQAALLPSGTNPSSNLIFESFWKQAIIGEDELRQRMTFALSQIFVISLADESVGNSPRSVADYYDMLSRNAFGNFRKLLEDVSLHPMMGTYLTHIRNQKEDPARGRVPDENYAREVMQLFTIGLYQLNQDGTVRLDSRNEPIETYTNDDVSGLAKVFTGFSWAGPDKSDNRFFGGTADPDRAIRPMQGYPKFHSTSEKQFLGVTIPVQNPAAPETSLRIALDALFNHPNVGPFIGKQLIQRLVVSNPSPAYVARVSAAFANNGQGVRGDLRAVIYAILTDPEARSATRLTSTTWGKVREPVLRLAAFLRATNARSASGRFLMTSTDDPANSLGQTVLRSPSVFNFFRPGYIPPNSALANAGLSAPELQIVHETSVAGYLNFMRSVVQNGIGSGNPRDVQPDYAPFIAVANDPPLLATRIDEALTSGLMSEATRNQIRDAIASVAIPTNSASAADTARRNRVMLGFFLALASPDFLVQR